jgi:hypothetical protein
MMTEYKMAEEMMDDGWMSGCRGLAIAQLMGANIYPRGGPKSLMRWISG